jgi:hypothetical protein
MACLCLLLAAIPGLALQAGAEGSAALGGHAVAQQTVLGVDILNVGPESFVWTGTGSVTVRDPNGQLVGSFSPGATISPSIQGTYTVELAADQTGAWDLTVSSFGLPLAGRVHSLHWYLDSQGFGQASSADYSLYALVPAGGSSDREALEVRLEGVAGFLYELSANRTGVDGPRAGSSVPSTGASATPELGLYLDIPEDATFSSLSPSLSGFSADGAPGGGYDFAFQSNVEGTYHVILDADMDGVFDLTGNDVVLSGIAVPGGNDVFWSGFDRYGQSLPSGIYSVLVRLNVGECHVVLGDAETLYPGLRIFHVDSSQLRFGANMFWNDSAVQGNAVTMPNGQQGLETSGPFGVDAAAFTDPTAANTNAHAWGDFSGQGKGDDSLMDTFVWAQGTLSPTLPLAYTGPVPQAVPVPGSVPVATLLVTLITGIAVLRSRRRAGP